MTARYCTLVASCFAPINITKRIAIKNMGLLNDFCNNYIATRGVAKGTCFIPETRLSIIKKQTSQKTYSQGNSSFASDFKPVVKHDEIGKSFYIDRDSLVCAHLDYEKTNRLIKIIHTEVSRAVAGRGYSKLLAREALEFVADHGYHLQIECDIVRNYVLKYAPQYLKYVKY